LIHGCWRGGRRVGPAVRGGRERPETDIPGDFNHVTVNEVERLAAGTQAVESSGNASRGLIMKKCILGTAIAGA